MLPNSLCCHLSCTPSPQVSSFFWRHPHAALGLDWPAAAAHSVARQYPKTRCLPNRGMRVDSELNLYLQTKLRHEDVRKRRDTNLLTADVNCGYEMSQAGAACTHHGAHSRDIARPKSRASTSKRSGCGHLGAISEKSFCCDIVPAGKSRAVLQGVATPRSPWWLPPAASDELSVISTSVFTSRHCNPA